MNTKLTSVLFLSIILFFLTVNPSHLISQQNDKATSLKPSDASYNVVKKAFWLAFQEYKQKVKDGYSVKPPVDPTGTFCVNDNGQMDIKNDKSPNQNHNGSNVINNDLIISSNGDSHSPHGIGTEKDLASSYTFTQSTTTYTAINTTGTLITSACDDSYYLNNPIGFSFNFNGTAYTAFCVSCNGWMNLGTTGTNTYYTPICTGSTPATLSPFAGDLYGTATGNGIYYQTTGTAPNRVFILEWHNWGFYSSGLNEMSFEVKLYETSNIVQFVYQPNTPSYSSNLQVGIMGATNADYNTRTSTTRPPVAALGRHPLPFLETTPMRPANYRVRSPGAQARLHDLRWSSMVRPIRPTGGRSQDDGRGIPLLPPTRITSQEHSVGLCPACDSGSHRPGVRQTPATCPPVGRGPPAEGESRKAMWGDSPLAKSTPRPGE